MSAASLVTPKKGATTRIQDFDHKPKFALRVATAGNQGMLQDGASERIPNNALGTSKPKRTASCASSAGNGGTYRKLASEPTPTSTPISTKNGNPALTAGNLGTSKPSAGSCIPKSRRRGQATSMNGAGTVKSQAIGPRSAGGCSRGWISRDSWG